MDGVEVSAALRELARAAVHLAGLFDGGGVAPRPAEPAETDAWRSPTRDLQPVVVAGEEDMAAALGRGHQCIVGGGEGGFVASALPDEERLVLLAVTLAGDAALEAAHAGLSSNAASVDAMLARGFVALTESAAAAGLAVPREAFIAAAGRFDELKCRGSEWR